jgi:hypothetical protein
MINMSNRQVSNKIVVIVDQESSFLVVDTTGLWMHSESRITPSHCHFHSQCGNFPCRPNDWERTPTEGIPSGLTAFFRVFQVNNEYSQRDA